MKPYLILTRAGLRAFLRDRAGLFWSFFLPVFFIVIFGSIFSNAGQSVRFKVGLVCPDKSPAAAWVPDVFSRVKVLDVQEGPLDQQRAKLAKGDLRVVVVFPPDFGESVMQHRPAGIKILTDP